MLKDKELKSKQQEINKIEADWSSAQKEIMKSKLSLSDAETCLLYTSPSPRDATLSRMPSSA